MNTGRWVHTVADAACCLAFFLTLCLSFCLVLCDAMRCTQIAMPPGGFNGVGTGTTVTALAIDQDLNSLFVAGTFQSYASCSFLSKKGCLMMPFFVSHPAHISDSNNFYLAKYSSSTGFVYFGNQTTGQFSVTSMRVINAGTFCKCGIVI